MRELFKKSDIIYQEIYKKEEQAEKLTAYYAECMKLGLFKLNDKIFIDLLTNPEDLIKTTITEKLNKQSKVTSIVGFAFKKKNIFELIESEQFEKFLAYYKENVEGKNLDKAIPSFDFDGATYTLKEQVRNRIERINTVTIDGKQEYALECYEQIVDGLNKLRKLKHYYEASTQIAELTNMIDFHITKREFTVDKAKIVNWRP